MAVLSFSFDTLVNEHKSCATVQQFTIDSRREQTTADACSTVSEVTHRKHPQRTANAKSARKSVWITIWITNCILCEMFTAVVACVIHLIAVATSFSISDGVALVERFEECCSITHSTKQECLPRYGVGNETGLELITAFDNDRLPNASLWIHMREYKGNPFITSIKLAAKDSHLLAETNNMQARSYDTESCTNSGFPDLCFNISQGMYDGAVSMTVDGRRTLIVFDGASQFLWIVDSGVDVRRSLDQFQSSVTIWRRNRINFVQFLVNGSVMTSVQDRAITQWSDLIPPAPQIGLTRQVFHGCPQPFCANHGVDVIYINTTSNEHTIAIHRTHHKWIFKNQPMPLELPLTQNAKLIKPGDDDHGLEGVVTTRVDSQLVSIKWFADFTKKEPTVEIFDPSYPDYPQLVEKIRAAAKLLVSKLPGDRFYWYNYEDKTICAATATKLLTVRTERFLHHRQSDQVAYRVNFPYVRRMTALYDDQYGNLRLIRGNVVLKTNLSAINELLKKKSMHAISDTKSMFGTFFKLEHCGFSAGRVDNLATISLMEFRREIDEDIREAAARGSRVKPIVGTVVGVFALCLIAAVTYVVIVWRREKRKVNYVSISDATSSHKDITTTLAETIRSTSTVTDVPLGLKELKTMPFSKTR